MKLVKLPSGHYGSNGKPAYEIVAERRAELGLSKGQFAKKHGFDRATQYKYEDGKNHSLAFTLAQLKAVGYVVTIIVHDP